MQRIVSFEYLSRGEQKKMTDCGTYQIQFDENTERYFVTETLEGATSGPRFDIEDALAWVRDSAWTPDKESVT